MATAQQPQSRTVQAAPSEREEKKGVLDLILDATPRLQPFLPKGERDEDGMKRVAAGVHLNLKQNALLADCFKSSFGRESVIEGVARILQWGLDLGVTAHLVPFRTKVKVDGKEEYHYLATPIADYKGLAQLMIASGAVRAIDTHVVREGDDFDYELGLEARLVHRPNSKSTAPITHAYCILRMRGGIPMWQVMSAEEIDEIRLRHSKQWARNAKGEVIPLQGWYARKTVLRQVAKLVPKDARLASALMVMQDEALAEELPPVLDAIVRGHEDGDDSPTMTSQALAALNGDVDDEQLDREIMEQDERSARAGR
jgi:recombination protein RecT